MMRMSRENNYIQGCGIHEYVLTVRVRVRVYECVVCMYDVCVCVCVFVCMHECVCMYDFM